MLEDAKLPSLRDKQLAQAQAQAEELAKAQKDAEEVEAATKKKVKTSKKKEE